MEIKKTNSNWKNICTKNLNFTQNEPLILTLPHHDHEFLQKFDKVHVLFNYLWDLDINNVKKNTIIQDYSHGGLKIIDYKEFRLPLKSTWIRRLNYGYMYIIEKLKY